jgi:hypothetical protein
MGGGSRTVGGGGGGCCRCNVRWWDMGPLM